MPELDANVARFLFKAESLPDDTFQVVSFSGVEEVSLPFRYDVHLVSEDPNIEYAAVVNQAATLTLMRGIEAVPLQGIVSYLEQAGRTKDFIVYRAILVPRLWLLSLTHQSRIFQQKTVREIVDEVLQDASLSSGTEYRFDLSGSYEPREYCVQYRETDLNFISRLLEHEGICYYFEHDDEREVLVMTDDRTKHPAVVDGELIYNEGAGMVTRGVEFVNELVCRERVVTGKVSEVDYNWRTPETKVEGSAQLNSDMPGEFYDFSEHVADGGQATSLAQVRNEELECRRRMVRGRTDCRAFMAGHTFSLLNHYREDLNEEYLLIRIRRQGSQRQALGLAGVGERNGQDDEPGYHTAFEAIPARVQYRPPRTTPVPQLPGIMTAKVDSAGGDYAYIDDDGSYRAILPFDRSGTSGGNATLPIRMAQPYSGPDYGIHFPLHQNTEIVWGCIDGDLDRPVALGTVPNPTNTSPATSANKQQNVIRTWGQNELTFDDTKGEENIYLFATKDRTTEVTNDHHETVGNNQTISVGTDRDKSVGANQSESVGKNKTIDVGENHTESIGGNASISVSGNEDVSVGENQSVSVGSNRSVSVGDNQSLSVGKNQSASIGKDASTNVGDNLTIEVGKDGKVLIGKKTTIQSGDDLTITGKKKAVINISDELTLKCGSASIILKKNGDIQIKGKKINVKGSGDVKIKGSKVAAN